MIPPSSLPPSSVLYDVHSFCSESFLLFADGRSQSVMGKFLGAFEELRKATNSFVMSVRLSAWNNSAPTGRIFMIFWVFFYNLSRRCKFHWNLTRITGILREHQYMFLIMSRSVLVWMRNVSDGISRKNQNTNFVFSNFFFENHVVYEIV
jgi:hypothetical protein